MDFFRDTIVKRQAKALLSSDREFKWVVSQREFAAVLKSAVFDQDFYLKTYPDIAQAGVNPLLHYLESGRFEKRKASATFDPTAYLEANPEVAKFRDRAVPSLRADRACGRSTAVPSGIDLP